MSVNYSPKTITDGLILYFDAGNILSYPGSGNILYDLCGNVNGNLLCGATYSNGSINFDGSNDRIDINKNNILSGMTPFTIECFFTLNSGDYGELFGNYGNGYSGSNQIWITTAGIYIGGAVYVSNYSTVTKGTHCLSCSRDNLGSTKTYLDSKLKNSGNLLNGIDTNVNYRMGIDVGESPGEGLNGKIYSLRVYNKVLSASEISQNYNSLKGRFGL